MNLERVQDTSSRIFRCNSSIERTDDALSIVSACYENDVEGLLLDGSLLPAAFFQLQTRFAGDFVQKLVNYRIKVAVVFAADEKYSERFREYVDEARSGHQFRTFADEASAVRWLES